MTQSKPGEGANCFPIEFNIVEPTLVLDSTSFLLVCQIIGYLKKEIVE